MGCSVSKMEAEGGTAQGKEVAGMRPIMRRIEDIRRRRNGRVRKDSIVSTTELLRPEDREVPDFAAMEEIEETEGDEAMQVHEKMSAEPEAVQEAAPAVQEQEEKKVSPATDAEEEEKKVSLATDAEEEKVSPVTDAEEEVAPAPAGQEKEEEEQDGRKVGWEEIPGSPSFRFFVLPPPATDANDDLFKTAPFDRNAKTTEKPEKIEEDVPQEKADSAEFVNSNEELEHKSPKKNKGRRLKALTKAPSRVYSFLNVRNCYNPGNSAAVAPARESL